MKKIYQNPEIKMVKVQTTQMIAASELRGFGDSVESASGAESRGGGFWDDEEEEY